MSYDDRLYIKQRFEKDGDERVNSLKMIEMVDYVQLYVKTGNNWAHIRLDRSAIEKIIKYLQNSLDSIK